MSNTANKSLFSAADIAVITGKPRPTGEQQLVIESELGKQSLVVAGAGSGKTQTMASRIIWLIVNGVVDPSKILGLTFTRKAAGELKTRVLRSLESVVSCETDKLSKAQFKALENVRQKIDESTPEIYTYDSFVGSVLQDYGAAYGYGSGRLISSATEWQIAERIVEAHAAGIPHLPSEKVNSLMKYVIALNNEINSHLIEIDELRKSISLWRAKFERYIAEYSLSKKESEVLRDYVKEDKPKNFEARLGLLELVEKLQEYKKKIGVMNFAEQTALTVRMLEEQPEVRNQVANKYEVVLLDEYQDTSIAQMRLLSSLFKEKTVTAVGDPNQAIYSWRGASSESMGAFQSFFPGASKDPFTLSISWRNDENILAAANHVAAPLRDKSLVHVPELYSRSEYVKCGKGEVVVDYRSADDEAYTDMAEYFKKNWYHYNHLRKGASKRRTAAILCRSHQTIQAVVSKFKSLGLPVVAVSKQDVLSSPTSRFIRALLAVAENPDNGDQLMILLDSLRIGAEDIRTLYNSVSGKDYPRAHLYWALQHVNDVYPRNLSSAARQRCLALREKIKSVQENIDLPLSELIRISASLLGLTLEGRIKGSGISLSHIETLIQLANEYTEDSVYTSLKGFLAWLDLYEEHERINGTDAIVEDFDQIQVMTVHAAKGLEWDIVAIAGLSNLKFPSIKYYSGVGDGETPADKGWLDSVYQVPYELRGDGRYLPRLSLDSARLDDTGKAINFIDFMIRVGSMKLAEERRLAYVAFTRAREKLFLSGSAFYGRTKKPKDPAVFLTEKMNEADAASFWDCDFISRKVVDAISDEENPKSGKTPVGVWPRLGRLETESNFKAAVEGVNAAIGRAITPGDSPLWKEALLLHQISMENPGYGTLDFDLFRASGLGRDLREPTDSLRERLRPIPKEPSLSAKLGNVFHAWARQEIMRDSFLDEAFDDLEAPVLPARQAKQLQKLRNNFRHLPFLRDKVGLEVETDMGFNLIEGMGEPIEIRGVADAILEDVNSGEIWIVDWKTGASPQPSDYQYLVHQLGVYRLGYKQRYPDIPMENIKSAYVYVSENKVIDFAEIISCLGIGEYDQNYLMSCLGKIRGAAAD